ncbi:hypothetical protein O1M63_43660 [Streptomyces mirabilis]|nr:hypothetical protein [Streptomyces mirabilis]
MVEQVPAFTGESLVALAQRIGEPVQLVARESDGVLGIAGPGWLKDRDGGLAVVARLPALYPEWLGDQDFTRTHGVRFPYVAGEMANGISGTELVSEMARAEMLAFIGSAGLSVEQLERVLAQLTDRLGSRRNWGANLLHQPESPAVEDSTAAALLRAGVPRISVSAYMTLTPAVIRCAATGLRRDPSGRIQRGAAVFAKVSRPEVAEQFMSPAPTELLRLLVGRGQLTADEARLAERVPVAEDVTVEADSGGHTDGRPLGVILLEVLALRDALAARLRLERPVRVGAAGGLGTRRQWRRRSHWVRRTW